MASPVKERRLFQSSMEMNGSGVSIFGLQQNLQAGRSRAKEDQPGTILDRSLSNCFVRSYQWHQPLKISSYMPKYSPLMLIPDVKTRAMEQHMRLQEQMEKIHRRQTRGSFYSRIHEVDSVQGSIGGYDAKGVWMFLAFGVIMGLVTGFLCFLLLCFHEKINLRGGRINSFLTGAFIGIFISSLTVFVVGLSAITRNGICASLNAT